MKEMMANSEEKCAASQEDVNSLPAASCSQNCSESNLANRNTEFWTLLSIPYSQASATSRKIQKYAFQSSLLINMALMATIYYWNSELGQDGSFKIGKI